MLRLNTAVGQKVRGCLESLPHLTMEATVQRSLQRSAGHCRAHPRVQMEGRSARGASTLARGLRIRQRAHIPQRDVHAHQEATRRGSNTWRSPSRSLSQFPHGISLNATSESWLGCETFLELNFNELVLPDRGPRTRSCLTCPQCPGRRCIHPRTRARRKEFFDLTRASSSFSTRSRRRRSTHCSIPNLTCCSARPRVPVRRSARSSR